MEEEIIVGYPLELNDADLHKEIIKLSKKAALELNSKISANKLFRFNFYSGMSQIGINEQQKRIAEKMRFENNRSQSTAKRFSIWAAFLTVVAITVSSLAAWFTYLDNKSDKVWETHQIELLEKINKHDSISATKTDSVWQNKNLELIENINEKIMSDN